MSMNELSSLLRRSFEGLGFSQADYEDAAAATVWLESHGFEGLDTVHGAWSHLQSRTVENTVISPDCTIRGRYEIDCGGASLLVRGRLMVEFVMAEANSGLVQAECHRVRDRLAILPSLVVSAGYGIAALAYWQNGSDFHVAGIEPGAAYPDYRVFTLPFDSDPSTRSICIVCCSNTQMIDDFRDALPQTKIAINALHISPREMANCREATLMNGLRVEPDYLRTLIVSAERVLVESTEQSRRGAGE